MMIDSALRWRTVLVTGFVALVAIAACDDGGTGPDDFDGSAETLLLVLETPSTNVGALLIEIDNAEPLSLESAASAYRVFWRMRSDGIIAVAVIGELVPGPLLSLRVAGHTDPGAIEATVLQVADRSNELTEASVASVEVHNP